MSAIPMIPTIVLDNGSHTIKLGLGGQAKPSIVAYNCAIKTPAKQSINQSNNQSSPTSQSLNQSVNQSPNNSATQSPNHMGSPSTYQSNDQSINQPISTQSLMDEDWEYGPPFLPTSQSNQSIYHSDAIIKSPYARGFVVDWSLQHSIWHRLLRSINQSVTDSCLLLSDPFFTPLSVRKSLDESVFEKYGFKAYYRINPPGLALRGYQYELQSLFGKPCSVIIDMGHACTSVTPMFNFVPIYNAVRRSSVGGRCLSAELASRIQTKLDAHSQSNHQSHHQSKITQMYATTIKEQCCYVSADFTQELRQVMSPAHHQSINQSINTLFPSLLPPLALSPERITIPESYFTPGLIDLREVGIAEMIVDSIESCDVHQRSLMYSHIVLIGGGAMFKGMVSRIQSAVRALAPHDMQVNVYSSKQSTFTTWCGGSCLSVDPQFGEVCVSKAQFEEHGHRYATIRAWQDEHIEM